MTETFLAKAAAMQEDLIHWRRILHQNPEIGFELPKTLAFVEDKLREFGYTPMRLGCAGIVVPAGKTGKTFLLRADMDALPMEEKSGLPFASTNGNCHSCGHDIHTASLLGAAKLLKEQEQELAGTVKIMFQPCEEGMGGMKDMLACGLLENPKPDAALAFHVIGEKTGSVGIRSGYAGASCDTFEITINGVGCHGAATYLGVDPINITAHLVTALQVLNSREVAPDQMLVVSVCTIHGGDAPNIVPDFCKISGTIRTADNTVREFAKKRVAEIANTVAATFRATAHVEMRDGAPPMINDTDLCSKLTMYINDILGEGTVWEIPAMTGSEDFSLLCESIPTVLAWVGTGNAEEGYPYNNHHSAVTFNEQAIHKISAAYAGCAARWLADNP